jgi:16S rRNA U516 pseudouridylate synthase RsuA-like enzyme
MKFCTIIHTKKPCYILFYKPNGMDYIVTFYGTKGAKNITQLVNKVRRNFPSCSKNCGYSTKIKH